MPLGPHPLARQWLRAVPLALAALDLVHPTWSAGPVYGAIAPIAGWWIVVHVLLPLVFDQGARGVPFALLVFAAVLP